MECVYFGVHPTLSTWGGRALEKSGLEVCPVAFSVSESLPFPLCTASRCSCAGDPCSSTACGLKTELGEIDDSLTGSCSPLPFVSLFVPKISNPRTLTVTSFGNFDRKAFYREIIKS